MNHPSSYHNTKARIQRGQGSEGRACNTPWMDSTDIDEYMIYAKSFHKKTNRLEQMIIQQVNIMYYITKVLLQSILEIPYVDSSLAGLLSQECIIICAYKSHALCCIDTDNFVA